MWQYYMDEPAVNNANGDIVDFNAGNATTNSFRVKKTTGETGDDGTKNVEVSFAELLKCL